MAKATTFKKRQREDILLYREGPSSFEDENALLMERGSKGDDLRPRGLDPVLSHSSETNKSIGSNCVAGSEVLIVYLARIGSSETESTVDLHNIELLIKSGANVNFRDLHGQTVMHEVALRWPPSLGDFFLKQGANVNATDIFGRTPLHVAVAVNSTEMVKWLIANGADVAARTFGEEQSPILFAAKYSALEVVSILMQHGAQISDRDYKERTPLQLAAETGREEAARLFLSLGSPSGVYDDTGTSCITHLIANMPDIANLALEQFYDIDKASTMAYYYLSYLETEKWQMIRKTYEKGARILNRREPLAEIVKMKDARLIMHPVIQRLIIKKIQLFGTRYFYTNLLINFVFTAVWTVLTFALPKINISSKTTGHIPFYQPFSINVWRVVLELIGLLMALYFVVKLRIASGEAVRLFTEDKFFRKQELSRDLQYCHPRWPQEEAYVRKRLTEVDNETAASLYDAWYYLDVASFVGLVWNFITRCSILTMDPSLTATYKHIVLAHYYSYAVLLIIIWLRFMQSFRPFITFGPFIAMMTYVVKDTIKFAFLFFEFYIPYCCAIWIIFGGPKAGADFKEFNDLMFEVFRMTVVDSFQYSQLTDNKSKVVAQIVCGTYFALVSITLLNLYIALLSETFAAVYGNATATAFMLQAEVLMNAERKMNSATRDALTSYIACKCSPEAVLEDAGDEDDEQAAMREIGSEIENLKRQCAAIRKMQLDMKPQVNFLKNDAIQILNSQTSIMKELEDGLTRINKDLQVKVKEAAAAAEAAKSSAKT